MFGVRYLRVRFGRRADAEGHYSGWRMSGIIEGMKTGWKLPGVLATLLATALIAGCGTKASPQAEAPPEEAAVEEQVTPEPVTPPYQLFDEARSIAYTKQLADGIGYRPEGSAAEQRAAEFVGTALSQMGYANVIVQSLPLPNGTVTYDVYADSPGSNPNQVVVIGAHMDTKAGTGSPGGNDNGSGVGAVLELARVLRTNPHVPTLRFAAFGAEEVLQGYSSGDHHYGSRYFAANLGLMPGKVIGMVSVDMIGVGLSFYINATLAAPATFIQLFEGWTQRMTVPYTFRQDTGASDHEAFEAHGIPSFWVEYRDDPYYHSTRDVAANLDPVKIKQVGHLVQGFLENLDPAACAALDAATLYH